MFGRLADDFTRTELGSASHKRPSASEVTVALKAITGQGLQGNAVESEVADYRQAWENNIQSTVYTSDNYHLKLANYSLHFTPHAYLNDCQLKTQCVSSIATRHSLPRDARD